MKNITNFVAFVALATLTHSAAFGQQNDMHQGQSMAPKASMSMTTSTFKGVEVNQGTVSFSMKNGVGMLSVSSDFAVPKSPAPHWQVVDGKGNVFLLNQFRIVGDKQNRTIQLPKYITSISKVQVWCSFAEVVLGEASFAKTINVR